MKGMTEAEVAKFEKKTGNKGKLTACPLCGGTQCESHERCFHCCACGYLQCCDYGGFFDRARKALQ